MDDFKISLFEDEYGVPFLHYKKFDTFEGRQLKQKLAERYKISLSQFENELLSKQSFYKHGDASEGFSLRECLAELGITPESQIFLNWYRFESVDAFNVEDLDKYFHNIWFPSADDIDLFDDSLNWIVSIRHDGTITYVTYSRSY